eukprot:117539_1
MAQQEYKVDETTQLLNNNSGGYTDLPKLSNDYKSSMRYPSSAAKQLFSASAQAVQPSNDNSIFSQLSIWIGYKRLMVFTRVAIGYFSFLFFVSVFGIIIYFVPILHLLIGFSIVLILTCGGSLCGMHLTYNWFFMKERTLADLSKSVLTMGDERERLQNLRHQLSSTVADIGKTVSKLSHSAADLEKTLKGYDELKNALQETVDKNESIKGLLEELMPIMRRQTFLKRENAKAQILNRYYHVAFKDKSDGLERDSYNGFAARLDTNTRSILNKVGGFDRYDSNDDGVIDSNEFMFLLEDVMDELEELEIDS